MPSEPFGGPPPSPNWPPPAPGSYPAAGGYTGYGGVPGGPYGPGPYGQGGYPTTQDHPDGTTILVLGILGLVVCGPLGIAAWVKGNRALAEIDAHPGLYGNRGSVQAGRICGMIACGILALYVLIAIVAVIAGLASAGSS